MMYVDYNPKNTDKTPNPIVANSCMPQQCVGDKNSVNQCFTGISTTAAECSAERLCTKGDKNSSILCTSDIDCPGGYTCGDVNPLKTSTMPYGCSTSKTTYWNCARGVKQWLYNFTQQQDNSWDDDIPNYYLSD